MVWISPGRTYDVIRSWCDCSFADTNILVYTGQPGVKKDATKGRATTVVPEKKFQEYSLNLSVSLHLDDQTFGSHPMI